MSSFEPKKFGRYVLIDKLAVGGMAEIYKAKTYGVDGFEKLLAIKRILPHCSADKDFINMLVDEAKLTVLLSHANIVQVYDLGKVGDDYFISMEFIHGTNLRELIRRVAEEEGKTAEELAVYITSEICKGLDYAHRKTDSSGKPLNIVHRDINPQNALISYEGEVKIVDFGIAKAAMNVSHTMAGVLKGKIAYMSPEQALGKPMTGGTDIYSAGLVLYEMLTGEKFYQGETQFELLNKIRTTHVSVEDLPESIPGPLKEILAKALAFSPKDRYESAGDLHLELTKYLYSSYIDFTPRQLASLVKKHFSEEMKSTEEKGPIIDEKTRSVILQESSMEHLISPPEPTGTDISYEEGYEGITADTAEVEIGDISSPSITVARRAAKPVQRRWLIPLLAVAALGLGYFAWAQFDVGDKIASLWKAPEETTPKPVKPERPVKPPPTEPIADYGAITISSEPRDATIWINGKNTGKTTPATLTKLPLGEDYAIKIQKNHHKTFEKSVALVTEEPVKIHGQLKALPDGALNIASDPPGAKIFLNNKDIGKTTPAVIEQLEIKKEYTLQLKKEGYGEWTSIVPLNSFEPVHLRASLSKLPEMIPKTPEPVKEPAPTLGALTVNSSPSSATVYLNGRNTGRVTPTQLEDLELGKFYTIKLSKSDFESWTKSVKVNKESGETLMASLSPIAKKPEPKPEPKTKPKVETKPKPKPRVEPKPTPRPKEVPVVPPEPRITTRPPPEPRYEPRPEPTPTPTTRPPVSAGGGSLKVKSSPSGAAVYVNAEYKGTTPLTVAGIPPGSAQLTVSKSGYLRYNSTVSIKPGKTKSVGTIKLEGLFGEIKVESQPPRAVVYFDGQRIVAKTPVTIRRVPRNMTHSLRVEMGGYRTWSASVDLGHQKVKRYNVMLQRN